MTVVAFKMNPIGIERQHIPLFRRLATIALKRDLPNTELRALLTCIGEMDAWPQLQIFHAMHKDMQNVSLNAEEKQDVVMAYLDLGVTLQQKIIIAYQHEMEH